MAVGITPVRDRARAGSVAWPSLTEAALVAAVIGVLLPLFASLSSQDAGRDSRFASASIAVRGLPEPVLPELCGMYASLAEPAVRERICSVAKPAKTGPHLDRLPSSLNAALARSEQAIVASIEQAQARSAELAAQSPDAGDTPFGIPPASRRQPADPAEATRALACTADWLRNTFAGNMKSTASAAETLRANAVLLAGAALEAHPALSGLLGVASLPESHAKSSACEGMSARQRLAGTAALIAEAQSTRANAVKDDAMRMLLRTARWQWAAWAVLGLVLLNLHRTGVSPVVGLGLALAAWAAIAWAFRVPWPLAPAHAFVLARPSLSLTGMPANFVLALLAFAALLLLAAPWVRRSAANAPSVPASVLTYPGLVAATGIGWLVLLDLSANGNFSNRYLALYHQGHLWLGMLMFTVVAFLRRPLGQGIAWVLSLVDGVASRIARRVSASGVFALFLPLALLVTALVASVLANLPQLTSELGRLWLIVGAAWFFFMRGTPLTERLAHSGNSMLSLARYISPLVFVVLVLVAAMILTHDMGPLLVTGYAAGAFVAASVAMWRYQRRGSTAAAYAFAVGGHDSVAASRLESVIAPFASINDQLALVSWFQRATPPEGFGIGTVPWCGFSATHGCGGVPVQIHSDYTFTALVGMFGWFVAWAITIGCALWLYAAVRPHGVASRGEPRFVHVGGRVRNDEQSFVSWICVAWVVMALCQLAVTVAGNLAVIPLTGVTFPFVSFGMTSLVANMAMLALAIDVPRRSSA